MTIHGPIPGTVRASGVWTGREVVVWGGWTQNQSDIGISGTSQQGAAYDPTRDRWRRIAQAPIDPRGGHLAAWAGDEMLVWGGYDESPFTDGALYDPTSDTWRRMAPVPEAPDLDFRKALREEFQFVETWAGDEWILGYKRSATEELDRLRLAAYDPASDTWRRLPDAEVSRTDALDLVWTGTELVLAHYEGLLRLAPPDLEWRAAAGTPGDLPIWGSMVWAEDRLYASIHRFDHPDPWAFLAGWDPTTDDWELLPMPPRSIAYAGLLSDGERIIPFGSRLAYDLASQQWWDVPMSISDRLRTDHVTVWTDREVVVWGGWVCGFCPQGIYDNGVVFRPDW